MTNARSLIALAALAASASLAMAQPAAPNTRADVKAEARAAVKAGTTAEGELTTQGPGRVTKAETTSDKSRTEVRSDARQAVKAGTTAEGERGGPAYSGRQAATGTTASAQSTVPRAEVKAKATSAVSGPAGEAKTLNTERTIPPQSPAQTR